MKILVRILVVFTCLLGLICTLASCDILPELEGYFPSTDGEGNLPPQDDDTNLPEECQHLYGDWAVLKDGYCEERKLQRTCQICGALDRRDGDESDHWWSEFETIEPTCTNEGYDKRVCEICKKFEKTNVIPATGEHNWQRAFLSEADCSTPETYLLMCQLCYTTKFEYVGEPTGEHSFGWFKTDSNTHTSYCKECRKAFNVDNHNIGADGICTICGYNTALETYDIEIWVPEIEGVATYFKKQVEDFLLLYPNYNLNVSISGITAADVTSLIVSDPACAPDLFCFTQDGLQRLASTGVLSAPTITSYEKIISENDEGSIRAATYNDTLFAYPMTNDNGYFMYYDKSVITNPDSLEQIIADCEAAGKDFRFALDNAWYMSSFFFGTGCESSWDLDENSHFVGVNDSFNSPEGLIAIRGMKKLFNSECYEPNADLIDYNTAVLISGMWNESYAESVLGDNLAAADLPYFEVDGKSYHLGSFSGNRLIGVKAQSDERKLTMLHLLAGYLSSEKCQLERFNEFGWIPTSLEAQSNEAVASCIAAHALCLQSQYARPQRIISGGWWDVATSLSNSIKKATVEEEFRAALDQYDSDIKKYCLYNESSNSWTVIGFINDTTWNYDFPMTEVSENIWKSEALYIATGGEFKLRKNRRWDQQVGLAVPFAGIETETGFYYRADSLDGDPANIVVEKGGYYIIRLELHEDTGWANVTLIPAE